MIPMLKNDLVFILLQTHMLSRTDFSAVSESVCDAAYRFKDNSQINGMFHAEFL